MSARTVSSSSSAVTRKGADDSVQTTQFPCQAMAMNKAWFHAALIAATLLAWLRLLALDGPLARAEPKTLRYLRPSRACP